MKKYQCSPASRAELNTPCAQMRVRGAGKWLAALAVLVLGAASAPALTNYVANPGFETTAFAPWLDTYAASHSVDNTGGYVYGSGNTIHEPAHSGTYTVKEWGDYWGSFWQAHTISQYVPAAPNSTWSADIWAYTATPDNIKGQNYAELEVSFCDASSNLITGTMAYSVQINTNTPVNTWIHLVATNTVDGTTNLVAPDGTGFIRFGLFLNQDPDQSGGSVYWDDANLIKTASSDPEISASPQNASVIYGQTATFTVLASGATPLSYAWQNDGGLLHNGGRIRGADTATLSISNVTTADNGNYSVTVTDQKGSLPSSSAYLTVVDPGILTNPASLQRIEGQSATFTVVAAGSGNLTYAWSKDGNPLSNGANISGANTATLTILNVTVADAGAYSVTVSGASMATSTDANLYVSTLAQAANLMRNSGFEQQMAYWTAWNGYGAVTTPPGAGETNYDGNYICQLYGTGAGTWNGVNQSFPTTAGTVYRASAWFFVSSAGAINGGSTSWLEVNFYNQGNLIGNFQSPIVNSNTPVGVWTNLSVPYAVAPANSDEVRCQFNFHAADGAGIVYLDDVVFASRIPVTITASPDGANLLLTFDTKPGAGYQVLYKNDWSDATWQLLQNVTGDLTGKSTVSTPRTINKRYYRVNTL